MGWKLQRTRARPTPPMAMVGSKAAVSSKATTLASPLLPMPVPNFSGKRLVLGAAIRQDSSPVPDGGEGYDYLNGGSGNDELYGSAGYSYLIGGAGNDTLDGGKDKKSDESATLSGDDGNDILIAYNSNDDLDGGSGNDTLTGGAGVDTFSFLSPLDGIDTITDFVVAFDTINVTASDEYTFRGGLTPGAAITPAQFRIGRVAGDEARSLHLQPKNWCPVL